MFLVDDIVMTVIEHKKLHKVNIKNKCGMKIPNIPPYIGGEHIWSYLSRLAIANGFCDTNHFINNLFFDEKDSKWKYFKKMQYDVSVERLGIFSVEGYDNWIAESTLYNFMLPFMGVSEQGNRIRRYAEPYHLKQSLMYSTAPLVRKLRICPECLKNDQQEGLVLLHLLHQVPGLEICPIHGCALSEFEGNHGMELSRLDLYRPVVPHGNAEYYAAFCQSLIKQHPSTNLHVLKEKLRGFVPDMSSWVHGTRQTLSLIDPFQAVHTISKYVDDIDSLIASLVAPNHQEQVIKDIAGRFEIVSQYSDAFVVAKCLKCGHDFPATPLSLMAGYGCPKCDEGMTRDELFHRMFNHVSKGEWELVSEFSGLTDNIRVRHVESGFEASTFAWCFLYKAFLPSSISIDMRAARWKEHETGQADRLRKRNEKIKSQVESSGEFKLVDIRGVRTNLRLVLRHLTCGTTFSVAWNNFLVSPFCRNCKAKGRWDEAEIALKISEASNGIFHWCGDVENRRWMASDGIRTICSSNGLQSLLSRVRRLSEFGDGLRDLSSLHRTIDSYIAERKGQVIFLEDMYPLYSEKNVISSYCSRLRKEGRIESSGNGIYWHAKEIHTADEVIYRKFCDRYGTLKGVPICDSLFSFWIADEKPCRHMVATQPTGTISCHLELRRKVMNLSLGVTQCPVIIDDDNAKAIAFIMTLKYAKYISCWNAERREQLKRWAICNDVTSSVIWKFREAFPKKLLMNCTKFLQGDLPNGKDDF